MDKENKEPGHKERDKEINSLFEKLLESRQEKLREIVKIKEGLVCKLDTEIQRLYAKKDLVMKMWTRREELSLQKIGVLRKFFRNTFLWNARYLVSMPFIYMMIVPGIVLHIFLEAYHQICFRLYGIALVDPRDHFIFDRRLLPYLNWFEKFNCCYCSYFNCLLSYAREIGGRTERYWCPIKHSKFMKDPHGQYDKFVDYDDGEALRAKWDEIKSIKN